MAVLYRVENNTTNQGLWYDMNGNYTDFITQLPNAISKDVPMGFNPDCVANGDAWYSAGESIQNMKEWLSRQDLIDLWKEGYRLFEIKVSDYSRTYGHAIFTKSQIIEKVEINMEVIYA